MSNFLYIGGRKGGCGKTTTAHLLCLGAILMRQPATYVLTDPEKALKTEGRPYGVIDGTDPKVLAQIIGNNANVANGWLIVDGGGNRPAFDAAMAKQADLCLLPFGDDDEMTDCVIKDLDAMPDAMAWPVNWPSNRLAAAEAQRHIDGLAAKYPLRMIQPPIVDVRSSKELLGKSLENPTTQVRSAARRAFMIMAERYNELATAQTGRGKLAAAE
jgi:hypothetical protein